MEPIVWDGHEAVRQARRMRRFAAALGNKGEQLEWDLVQVAILALAAKRAPAISVPVDRSPDAAGDPQIAPQVAWTEPEQTSPG